MNRFYSCVLVVMLSLLFCMSGVGWESPRGVYAAVPVGTINVAFAGAAQMSGVPVELLKALCYMEGHLSNHGGKPSIDGGYGCMHLLHNRVGDTLDEAARDLGVSIVQLESDLPTNIRGGALVLRNESLQLSPTHTVPGDLGGWYSTIVAYSHAPTPALGLFYADALYRLLHTGFAAPAETHEMINLPPQVVHPRVLQVVSTSKVARMLPAGCTSDTNVDYPDAVDCIIDPQTFDCNVIAAGYPHCSYESGNRPYDYSANYVVIHDAEGSLQDTLNVFQNRYSVVSSHYIVDTDGTVYEILHDKDIGYHAGNYWYNQHAIGIEHVGFDASGYLWYNAMQYLSSARLTAYLLRKFNIPLDHEHVVSHGTVPAPDLSTNHVDPGPYWLWSYYFGLIHEQGIAYPPPGTGQRVITLQPPAGQYPFGSGGQETSANFNFFYLYRGPSTSSGRITAAGGKADTTDETNNIEAGMSYYYLAQQPDPAGSGATMYQIWYGAETAGPFNLRRARLVWLAAPANSVVSGYGSALRLGSSGDVPVFGMPQSDASAIGTAPAGAIFNSAYTVIEDGTSNLWYEINYNHRQAFVPSSY